MTKKQMLYVRILAFLTAIAVSIIFIVKGLNIKSNNNTWLQWILGAAFVLVICLNYLTYLLLKINLIYNKNFIYGLSKLKSLRLNLISYCICSSLMQIIFIIILILAYDSPVLIGLNASSEINTAVFATFIVLLSVSTILTTARAIQKYKKKKNIIMEVIKNENKKH